MNTIKVENGNKTVNISIAEGTLWEKDGVARLYYEIEQDNKRNVLRKLYKIVSGTTRDSTIEIDGKVFGYQLGIDCNSNVKRAAAIEAIEELVKSL